MSRFWPLARLGRHPSVADIRGRRIAFLVANDGVEQVELTEPWNAVREAGGEPVLIAPSSDRVQGRNHLELADQFDVDQMARAANPEDYDALALPGGVANPDNLRQDEASVALVRAMALNGQPVAAICHAPWMLIEAGILDGRTVTSYPSLRTDLTNAGATWVDREVVVDDNLITSRRPDDLLAFCRELLDGVESRQAA